jgi:hypothetical protein
MPSASLEKRANSGQTSSTWSRKQWPVPSSSMVSRFSSRHDDSAACGQRVVAGTATMKGSSYSGAVARPVSGKGSARMAHVELAGAQHVQQLDGEVFLQDQRHLRRMLDGVRTSSGSR